MEANGTPPGTKEKKMKSQYIVVGTTKHMINTVKQMEAAKKAMRAEELWGCVRWEVRPGSVDVCLNTILWP